jgi:hypothetical protein
VTDASAGSLGFNPEWFQMCGAFDLYGQYFGLNALSGGSAGTLRGALDGLVLPIALTGAPAAPDG